MIFFEKINPRVFNVCCKKSLTKLARKTIVKQYPNVLINLNSLKMEKDIKIEACKKIDTFDSNKRSNGWLLELISELDGFTPPFKGQFYLTVVEPNYFKGFHMYATADCWVICIKGKIREVFYKDISTKEEVEMGDGDFKKIFIPRGCPHGVKNIGAEPAYIITYRNPPWKPELKERLDISPEEIEKEEVWGKIRDYMNEFKNND